MKTLKAVKCSDGWYVTISDHIVVETTNDAVKTINDVYKIIRENGLKVVSEKVDIIYAD